MTHEEIKKYVRYHVEKYLKPDGCGRGYICPICGSGSGKNGTGITTKDGVHYTCWAGCFSNIDILDIIGMQYGITDYLGKIEKASEIYGVTLESDYKPSAGKGTVTFKTELQKLPEKQDEPKADYTEFYKQCSARISETDYMRQRGISDETCRRYSIGYCPLWKHPKAPNAKPIEVIIIPTSESTYVVRHTDQRSDQRYMNVGASRLFNAQALKEADKPIIITEGEIDALSVYEVGGVAVGLGSTSNVKQLARMLETLKPSQPLIIALDNDEAGNKASVELETRLKELQILFYRHNLYGSCKDANEALKADREGFRRAVEWANQIQISAEASEKEAEKEAYLRTSVADQLQSFIDSVKESADSPIYSTGFSAFDRLLDGGLHEGLVILGALSSIGKTTFVLQIADYIAQHGQDVLVFALEMSRNELISKSLSRLTYQDAILNGEDIKNAKTARGISDGKRYPAYNAQEMRLIERAILQYQQYAKHLFIREGIGSIGVEQIREAVRRHIAFTGNKPLIIVDYLQILAPADVRATDKQNIDIAVLELKRISRDCHVPVVAISSFNRENYKGTVNMTAFKESGAIEYSADVLIGLQFTHAGDKDFDLENEKDKEPRDIELKILKNRQGKVGKRAVVRFEYYPKFDFFKEC